MPFFQIRKKTVRDDGGENIVLRKVFLAFSTSFFHSVSSRSTDPSETLAFIDLGSGGNSHLDLLKAILDNQVDQGKIGNILISITGPNYWRLISANGKCDHLK